MTLGKIFYKGFPSGPRSPKSYPAELFNQMADAYAKKRIASAGLFASGWLWAGRKLRDAYVMAGGTDMGRSAIRNPMEGRRRGGVGDGIPASSSVNATATLINRSVNPRDPSSAVAAKRIIPPGIRLAFQAVADDMRDYITRTLEARGRLWRSRLSTPRRF